MRTRLIPASLLTLGLALAAPAAIFAQDAPGLAPDVAYSTGSLVGEAADSVEPEEEFPAKGLRQMRGWSIVGIPVEMDDPRVSGLLTIVANGSGQDFENGFANIESRTYRIENDEGTWTGAGNYALAVRDDEALIDLETAILTGEGEYDGLTAFLSIEFTGGNRNFEAVVVEGAPAPVPDPVPATAVEDAAAAS